MSLTQRIRGAIDEDSERMSTVRTIQLEQLRYAIVQRLSREFAIDAAVDFNECSRFMADDIAVLVVQAVLGEKLREIESKWPADWWQAVRERWVPAWWLRRWPVRYKRERIEAWTVYPSMPKPRSATVFKRVEVWPEEADG